MDLDVGAVEEVARAASEEPAASFLRWSTEDLAAWAVLQPCLLDLGEEALLAR